MKQLMISLPRYLTEENSPYGYESCLGLTGSSGIPARNASGFAGKAEDIQRVYIATDGELTTASANSSSQVTMTVYNPFGTAIAGDTYITCKRVDGAWIVDAEDCS